MLTPLWETVSKDLFSDDNERENVVEVAKSASEIVFSPVAESSLLSLAVPKEESDKESSSSSSDESEEDDVGKGKEREIVKQVIKISCVDYQSANPVELLRQNQNLDCELVKYSWAYKPREDGSFDPMLVRVYDIEKKIWKHLKCSCWSKYFSEFYEFLCEDYDKWSALKKHSAQIYVKICKCDC